MTPAGQSLSKSVAARVSSVKVRIFCLVDELSTNCR
jgi:hypothetical protein